MARIELELANGTDCFEPGDTVSGVVSFDLDEPPESVELHLFWHTEGRGDEDIGIVAAQPIEGAGQRDRRSFSFTLPPGPCSFSGSLISIRWAIELLAEPGEIVERWHLVVGPDGREIEVSEIPKEIPKDLPPAAAKLVSALERKRDGQ